MTSQVRVGLLPLYLQLYDKTSPERRREFEPFLATIRDGFEHYGIAVTMADICCIEPEFERAVIAMEAAGVDLIVAVHLAYSPSLEAVGALCKTSLPLLLLDTTMDYDFGQNVDPARISFDHGIHGVQDLASVLRRRKRHYEIVAGHVTESGVLRRAARIARAAHAARRLHGARVLRVGESFRGMGDFAVTPEVLEKTFGIEVQTVDIDTLAREVEQVTPQAIAEEMAEDREQFGVEADETTHERTTRVCLGLRRLLEQRACMAFSMNFLAFDTPDGLVNTVPFLEASKGMGRGLGYAGEGDVLTACLVGALNAGFGSTTFTEIFCPDWKGDSLFLSHMGEINPLIANAKPRLIEMDFPYTNALNPAIITAGFAPGPAVLVNLGPGPDDSFGLVAAEVEVLEDSVHPKMRDSIRAWIRPQAQPIARFLEGYSYWGGTHHSALVYGLPMETLAAFASFSGLPLHWVWQSPLEHKTM